MKLNPFYLTLALLSLSLCPLGHCNGSIPTFENKGATVLPTSPTDDQQLEWIVSELKVLEKAAREFESRQEQGAPAVKFRYNDLILDLNTIINGIESKLNRRDNPAYQFEVLKSESVGY